MTAYALLTKISYSTMPESSTWTPVARRRSRLIELRQWANKLAPNYSKWRTKNQYFHSADQAYLRFLVQEEQRVIEVGCGTGHMLAALKPQYGVGLDLSPEMIQIAADSHPELHFFILDAENSEGLSTVRNLGPFDVILLDSTLGFLSDIQQFLNELSPLCHQDTRLVVTSHSYLWEPLFSLATLLRLRLSTPPITWLRLSDIENLLKLGGFETVKQESRLISPYRFLGIGSLFNRFIATLPFIQKAGFRQYLVARPISKTENTRTLSASVVIPCRNEKGNVEAAVKRLPIFCQDLEIIFVEGHSEDSTWDEILRVQRLYVDRKISALKQPGMGKGDAVRAAFEIASGDVLIILDADLTVPPEDIPKFYDAIASGQGEFINGSRMIYGMEEGAMRFLNRIANHFFAKVFSYLLNQTYTDTLCGTKVLRRTHYQAISMNRTYFGDFDPFGDFDLIFGAARLHLKVVEIPIRYASRVYGTTQISRFRHGVLLFRMVIFAWRKLKAL